MLAREVVEQTFNTILQAGGANRPTFDVLDASILAAATSFVARGRKAPPQPHTLLEIDYELILPDTVSAVGVPSGTKYTVTPVAGVGRGYQESVAADHAAGALIIFAPRWPKITVLNALKGVIGQLFGWGLYARVATTAYNADTSLTQTLPVGATDIISIRERLYSSPEMWSRPFRKGKDFEVYTDVGDDAQIPFQLLVGDQNNPLRILYKSDFTIPDDFDQDTDLTDECFVPETLQPHLPLAVAGSLLAGKEVPRMQAEAIRRVLETSGGEMPVGSTLQVGRALTDTFRFSHVASERERLVKKDGIRLVYKSA